MSLEKINYDNLGIITDFKDEAYIVEPREELYVHGDEEKPLKILKIYSMYPENEGKKNEMFNFDLEEFLDEELWNLGCESNTGLGFVIVSPGVINIKIIIA